MDVKQYGKVVAEESVLSEGNLDVRRRVNLTATGIFFIGEHQLFIEGPPEVARRFVVRLEDKGIGLHTLS